jgi:hypothetical protein
MELIALAVALSRLDVLEIRLNRLFEAIESPFGNEEDGPESDYRVLEAAVKDVREIRTLLAGGGV